MPDLLIDNIPNAIRRVKAELRSALPNYTDVFRQVETAIFAELNNLKHQYVAGEHPIPQLSADDIFSRRITEQQHRIIRQRGCCVVREVFPRDRAVDWTGMNKSVTICRIMRLMLASGGPYPIITFLHLNPANHKFMASTGHVHKYRPVRIPECTKCDYS